LDKDQRQLGVGVLLRNGGLIGPIEDTAATVDVVDGQVVWHMTPSFARAFEDGLVLSLARFGIDPDGEHFGKQR